jgi:flagellar motor switch protein FliG
VKVTLTGKQKAAMLLASLDVGTAVELLKGIEPGVVQELAVELAYLDAAGFNSKDGLELARQFVNCLQVRDEIHLKSFLRRMLKGAVGDDGAKRIQMQIQDLLQKRDPFISVRSADSQTIASILENEHPQAVAVVLSEMSAKKSSEVLGLMGEGMRLSAVSRMTSSEAVTAEAKVRIAEMVCKRLEAATSGRWGAASQARSKQSLRKLAVILRNLGKELRDGLQKERYRRGQRGNCPGFASNG